MQKAVNKDFTSLFKESDHMLIDDRLTVGADGSFVHDKALKELEVLEVVVIGFVLVVLKLLLETGVLLRKEVFTVSLSKDKQALLLCHPTMQN